MKTKSPTPSTLGPWPQYRVSIRGEMGRLLLLRLQERDQTVQNYLTQLVLEDLFTSRRPRSSARR